MMDNYLVICNKRSYTDRCMGCDMGTYHSDLEVFPGLDIGSAVYEIVRHMDENDEEPDDRAPLWEISIYRNSDDLSDDDEIHDMVKKAYAAVVEKRKLKKRLENEEKARQKELKRKEALIKKEADELEELERLKKKYEGKNS